MRTIARGLRWSLRDQNVVGIGPSLSPYKGNAAVIFDASSRFLSVFDEDGMLLLGESSSDIVGAATRPLETQTTGLSSQDALFWQAQGRKTALQELPVLVPSRPTSDVAGTLF